MPHHGIVISHPPGLKPLHPPAAPPTRRPPVAAVLHFVNWTARASFEAIGVETVAIREKDRKAAEEAEFYTIQETQAALTLVRLLVRRMRARRNWRTTVTVALGAAAGEEEGLVAPLGGAAEVFAEIPESFRAQHTG